MLVNILVNTEHMIGSVGRARDLDPGVLRSSTALGVELTKINRYMCKNKKYSGK